MRLISTNAELNRQLERLVEKYPHIAIATAWASADTEIFKALVKHKERIFRAVIGTHFYQTDPDVLEQFAGSSKVKFILQPDGVFHPKVYLFWSDEEAWEFVIGSPNLTAGALTKNSELSVLIDSGDGQPALKREISEVIDGYWVQARTVHQAEADNYRKLWKLKTRDLKKVADIFGDRPASRPAVQSRVMSMDWKSYLAEVKKDKTHGFGPRLAMLQSVEQIFACHKHFNDIPIDDRKGIAGIYKSESIQNPEWFGSMKAYGFFSQYIDQGNPYFSSALDEIPLAGDIRQEHYDRFIAEYKKAFPEGCKLGLATRLLAMKRPDVFLCVDGKNKRELGEDVGIKGSDKLDYKRYWEEVVLRLMQSPWWQSPEPSEPEEKAAWRARAAMLDAIFYEEKVKKA